MRTIKFRVWNKEVQEMEEVRKIKFNNSGIEPYQIFAGYPEPIDSFELMQFTGVFDVNGKEIFEGDIIKHRYFSLKGVAEVRWNDDEACFLAMEPNGARIILRPNSEIIGNIYENPELIKDQIR
jgi:uncharacterized phage protein (TIGR01671 family)